MTDPESRERLFYQAFGASIVSSAPSMEVVSIAQELATGIEASFAGEFKTSPWLAVLDQPAFGAEARADFKTDKPLCMVTSGLLWSLQPILLSLWCEEQVMPWIHDGERLDRTDPESETPPGFEVLMATASGNIDLAIKAYMQFAENIALAKYKRLGPQRQAAYRASLIAAIRFIWYHEVAHSQLGHLNLLKELFGLNGLAERSMRPQTPEARRKCQLQQYLEIEADTFAIQRLFMPGIAKNDVNILALSIVAAYVLMLALHAAGDAALSTTPEESTHPPLWHRAHRMRAILSNMTPAGKLRDRSAWCAERAIAGIAGVHWLIGDWMGAQLEGDITAASRRYAKKLSVKLEPWQKDINDMKSNRHAP